MYFENTGIENIVADLSILDEIMLEHDLSSRWTMGLRTGNIMIKNM